MATAQEILSSPDYINANLATKQAIFDKHIASTPDYVGANTATQTAIQKRFGLADAAEVPQGRLTAESYKAAVDARKANPLPSDRYTTRTGFVQSMLSGPTFGFADELTGALMAPVTAIKEGVGLGEAYRKERDIARANEKRFAAEHPAVGFVTPIVSGIAAAPIMPVGAAAEGAGVIANALRGLGVGAGYGAIGGLGHSEAADAGGMAGDVAKGAVLGGALSGAAPIVATGISKARNAMGIIGSAPRANNASIAGQAGVQQAQLTPAEQFALQKVAEAIARNARGETVTSGASSPQLQASARLNKLGEQATLADTGVAANQLLDVLTTIPGQTKAAVVAAQRARQASEPGRMIESAAQSLGTQGKRLPQTLEDLAAVRSQASKPLYDVVNQAEIAATPELADLLARAESSFGRIRDVSKVSGEKFTLTEGATQPGSPVSLKQIDMLKRHLYDIEQGHINPETGKLDEYGRAFQNLRRDIVAEADKLTTDPATGQSFYKAARDAYAGPTELRSAANLGAQAMTKDAWKIGEQLSGMNASEIEAFKVGAFEALRKKLGGQSGRTEIMDMWKNTNTQEKLKEIFGTERAFREFASSVAAERQLRQFNKIGQGSQTAERLAGQADIINPAIADIGGVVGSAKTGNVGGLINSIMSLYNQATLPEKVRNEMGRILLMKGQEGKNALANMRNLIDQINAQNQLRSIRSIQAGSAIGSNLAAPLAVRQ